jgi:S-disulfanyl-L-cysteine oxidoreductase SoxD
MAIARRRPVVLLILLWSANPWSAGLSLGAAARPVHRRAEREGGRAEAAGERVLLAQSPTFGLGHPPSPDHLKAIDIEVTPDGKGLAPGRGTAAAGKDVYTRRCETCHGPTGKEGPQDVIVGGRGSLTTNQPLKTVGSYWPYATTLWDYIRRAMPFDHPGTLTPDELYSVTAYVLFMNGIVGEQDALNQTTLPQVKMPNRDGFVADPRPDVPVAKKK